MSRNLQSIAPTIAQYPSYDELLANSEQVPLSEFQSLNANEMPRFADGLFDLPPGPGLRRKRKRLSDFSEKEKQARRKLKNRIAAQSARDRKRFEADQNMKNMGELEAEVKRLRAENRELRQENSQLREDNHGLRQDNMILRQENGNTRTSSPKMRRFNENFHGQNSGYSSWNSAHSSPNTSPNNSYVNINSISGNTNKSVANNNVIVDPHAVERTLSNNSVVPTSSNQLLQVVGPADGLPMPQGRTVIATQESSCNMEAIMDNVTTDSTSNTKKIIFAKRKLQPKFEQIQALYTLVMTVLFQTAGTMMDRMDKSNNSNQSNSKELNRRLRAVQNLKEKTKQARVLASPITFWETQNLYKKDTQVETAKNHQKHLQNLPKSFYHLKPSNQVYPDKSQTKLFSTTSSKTSQKTEMATIPSSLTMLSDKQKFSNGGQDLTIKNCPIHAAKTQNCLACQCKNPVKMDQEFLLKINISDHMLRQATQAVQRKRKMQRAQQI